MTTQTITTTLLPAKHLPPSSTKQHRSRYRTQSDPFIDPINPYGSKPAPRAPPEPPPKYHSAVKMSASVKPAPPRDNIVEAVRDTVTLRNPDNSPRRRMGRSQTTVPASNTSPTRAPLIGRRSHSQDSVIQAANAIEKAKGGGKSRGKKGSVHADVIDRLDPTGGGPMFHHDGPFDACAPSRNRHKTKAPMLAWSSAPKNELPYTSESPYPSPQVMKNSFTPTYAAPKKRVDAIAEAWGIHEPEPYEEFFAGGGTNNRHDLSDTPSNPVPAGRDGYGARNGNPLPQTYTSHTVGPPTNGKRSKDTRDIRDIYKEYLDADIQQLQQPRDSREHARERGERSRTAKRGGVPPPQPILIPEGPQSDLETSGPSSPPAFPGAPKRTKSLMHRIRKMRDSPNVPVGSEDVIDSSPSPPSSSENASPRPNHRAQNSFLGRFAGGTNRRQYPDTSSPTSDNSETYVYVEDPKREKELPATPYSRPSISANENVRGGYFDASPGTLGRKTSLLKKVKGVVTGSR